MDYAGVRMHPQRFAVLAEHVVEEAQRVVATRGAWAVVEMLRVRLSRTVKSKDTTKRSDLIPCVQKWPMGKLCRGVSDY